MEYSWSYNNGQPNSGGSGQGTFSYVNAGHIQQDNSGAFDDAAGFGYPASQVGGDPEAMDFDEPNDNMNQAGIDQMSLDLDEVDSQTDFDIDGSFDHPGVSQPNDNMDQAVQAGIDQIGLDLAGPDDNHPGFGHTNHHSTRYAHAGKTITQMVEEQTNGEYQGYFTSRQHRKDLEEQYMQQQAASMLATITPASLADLPGEDEGKLREWRQKITEAIRDCTNVVNKDRIHETKNKKGEVIKRVVIENTHVRRVRTLSLFVTELIADKILETAEEAHQGNTGIAPWVEKSSWVLEKFPTFNDRMQAVLEALRRNKSVAHSFIQVDPTLRFVAAPKAEIKGKDENMTCNGNRGELIREGLKVKKAEGKTAKGKKTKGKKAKGTEAEGEKAKGKNAEGN